MEEEQKEQKMEEPNEGDLVEEEEEEEEETTTETEEKNKKSKPKQGPKITLSDVKMFKEGIQSINNLVVEAKIVLDENGLTILCMDPANVAMIEFAMDKNAFTEYNVQAPTEVILDLGSLHQRLKRVKGDAILTLHFDETLVRMTVIGKINKEFTLPIIEDDSLTDNKKPELSFEATTEIDIKVLKEGFDDVGIVAEAVIFTAKDNKFVLSGAGDISNVEINMLEAVNVNHTDKQQCKYALEYLNKMMPSKIFNTAKVSFKTDYPLLLEYKSEEGDVRLSYILAPRVEEN